jgi:two-component system NtrC family response regulator
VIGSAAECDVVVSDATVSRRHVELQLVPEGVAVRDLGSRNGTFHLGQRLQQMVLFPGARVSIGSTELVIDLDADSLQSEAIHPEESFRGMVGRSIALRKLFAMVSRLDGSLVPLLISGESGVGKELVARAIHEGSRVAGGPFLTVNCGAIARELVASELFGHTRGAYTGAVQSRRGAFETADGGTLFLDEIAELPLDVQPMLLRALESGEIRAVGADESKHTRVRCLAATNRDLQRQVAEGRFREDLYYRLAEIVINIPPLRERTGDAALLAHAFVRRFAHEQNRNSLSLSEEAVRAIETHAWPGNVRELASCMRRAAIMADGNQVTSADLGLKAAENGEDADAFDLRTARDATERRTILAALGRVNGNIAKAADLLGVSRPTLYDLMHRLNLK